MNQPRLAVVILAAGEGTRMQSTLPKVLHPLGGRPMVAHVLAVAEALEADSIMLVLSNETLEPVRAALAGVPSARSRIDYCVQAERLGTGHAVMQARAALIGACDDVIVLFGDTPLLRATTAQSILALHHSSNALLTLLSFRPAAPGGYGRVVRDAGGNVVALVEERDATPEQRAIGEANSGIMCFRAAWLWQALEELRPSPVKGEYYMTDLVALAVRDGGSGAVLATEIADEREAWGVNTRVQLAQAEAVFQQRLCEALMQSGVTIIDPGQVYLDVGVTVGRDTTLWPGTVLRGATRIGTGCTIGPQATLIDAGIGDHVTIRHAVVERTSVAAGSIVGPFEFWHDRLPASESA